MSSEQGKELSGSEKNTMKLFTQKTFALIRNSLSVGHKKYYYLSKATYRLFA